jgi:hypothetical protein
MIGGWAFAELEPPAVLAHGPPNVPREAAFDERNPRPQNMEAGT